MASVFEYPPAAASQERRDSAGRSNRTSVARRALGFLREPHRPRLLAALIDGDIIPRLTTSRRDVAPKMPTEATIGSEEVDAFVPFALHVDAGELLARVEALIARGVTINALMLDLLAPVARRLGELWEDDRCDFVDVTMGLWRLQQIVHDLTARYPMDPHRSARRALFLSMPGDQHSFGATMVEEVFRLEGWDTDLLVDPSDHDLLERAACGWYDIVGLTVSLACHIERVPSVIQGLRSVSLNPRIRVMVGGPAINADPALATRIGADGTASDAKMAVKLAEEIVGVLAREPAYC